MKKLFIFVSVLFIFSCSSFAWNVGNCWLSNDNILSQTIQKGSWGLSARAEYWTASQAYIDEEMLPATSFVNSYTIAVVPLRASYGITDALTARLTVPIVDIFKNYHPNSALHYRGYGLADSKLEAICQIAKETREMPSIALNAGITIMSGKDFNQTSIGEFTTGTGATDQYLSVILGKKFGNISGKAMLGLIQKGYFDDGIRYAPANQVICALSGRYPLNGSLDIGGELSGMFAARDEWDTPVPTPLEELTAVTLISFSPSLTYRPSENMSCSCVIEIPFGTQGTHTASDMGIRQYRGANISVGAEMTI